MGKSLRSGGALIALALIINVTGCVTETTNTANTNMTTANSNTIASPSPASSPAMTVRDANYVPVTLPVLDAMFAEESFAPELKTKLQLTDEQVEKLRTTARAETGKLRETEGDEYSGSTAAARSQADAQIRAALGEEKAKQLETFVRERWNSGGEGGGTTAEGPASPTTTGSKPNVVPTDTRIVVNAPAYRMDVFESGKLIKTYKVGIGYPEFPLPTGLRKATTIIFNPTWTPPDEPWVESPSSKVKVGQKVEAGSALNPLGPIKIPIGSPSLIHGGKSPAKLGSFASHGCVGLTNAGVQDFAQMLGKLAGTEITKENVAEYAKNKTETKDVKLAKSVPVELRYETIVVEDGKLRIYRDVYDRDTNTEENLRAVLEAHGVSLDQLSEGERTQVTRALTQMARDASGNPTDGALNATPGASPVASPTNVANKNTNTQQQGERVTRGVKGQKEVVIEIAALAGKGYPAPVGGEFKSAQPQKKSGAARAGGRG